MYQKSINSRTYTSNDLKPEIIEQVSKDFYSSCTLRYNMYLPDGFNPQSEKRTENPVLNRVEITLSINSEQPWLNVDFFIDNKSKNHRLRALVNTGIKSDLTSASSPFDIIHRDRRDVLNGIKKWNTT